MFFVRIMLLTKPVVIITHCYELLFYDVKKTILILYVCCNPTVIFSIQLIKIVIFEQCTIYYFICIKHRHLIKVNKKKTKAY